MPRKAQPPVRIVVDAGERRSEVYRLLAALLEVELEERLLAVGDYLLGDGLAVERKTTDDFAASIQDRRLFVQAAALKTAFPCAVVLIEGAFPPERSRMHLNALRGALSSLIAIEGVSVLRSDGPEDSALLLAQLARHAQQGSPLPTAFPKRRAGTLADQQLRLIAALPDIGETLARQVLAHFGSPRALLTASEPELRSVRGIGPTRAAAIRRVFDTTYDPPLDASPAVAPPAETEGS